MKTTILSYRGVITTGCACALFAGILSIPEPTAQAVEWSDMGPTPLTSGPFSGRTTGIVTSPTDRNKYFIATATGGIWKTTNGGFAWTALTDQLPMLSIGALTSDPADENILYAGSGEANFANHSYYGLGLYKSVDGGDQWDVLATETFAGRTFSKLLVSHGNSQVVYASIMHAGGFPARNAAKGHPRMNDPVGVYRSDNGGDSWTLLTNGLPAVSASDIIIDPIDPDVLYAAIGDIFGDPGNGIYKSIDGGDSWTQLTDGLPSAPGRISIAVAPSRPQRLYALVTNPSDATGGSATTDDLYRSDDFGATWTSTNPSGLLQATYGWYLSTVIVDPEDYDTFFFAGVTLLRSTNGGDTYTNVTPPHVDIHALMYDPIHRLICADDGGIHRSSDNGRRWVALNNDLGAVQFYPGVSLHPTDASFVLGGAQDNGTNRRSGASTWTNVLGGDGGFTAIHPDNPSTMFAEFQGTGNLYRSQSGGPFTLARNGIELSDRNCFMPPIDYAADNTNVLLYGTHRIYRSTNNGTSWTPISEDLTSGPPFAIRALVQAPSNAQTVYAATNGGRVLVSRDGGGNWDITLTDVPGWPRVTRELAVDPLDDGTAYLAVAQFGLDQVRMTTDYGDTWIAIDGNLPDIPANCVAVRNTEAFTTIFIGTDSGVYQSNNQGVHWSKLGTNMPNTPVSDLIVDAAFERLVAVTFGRGIWSMALPQWGDGDGDGDVDLVDVGGLFACFSGPFDQIDFVEPTVECRDAFDFDVDTDVDLADFLAMTDSLFGP